MADITAAQINTELGVNVFDDNGGAGPLVLDLDVLTGDNLTLASDMAEAMAKLVKACADTALAEFTADSANDARSTYPAVTQTPTTVNGKPVLRTTAQVIVAEQITSTLNSAISLSDVA